MLLGVTCLGWHRLFWGSAGTCASSGTQIQAPRLGGTHHSTRFTAFSWHVTTNLSEPNLKPVLRSCSAKAP